MTFSSFVMYIMYGSSSNKLMRFFFLLELPEKIFIDPDTFFPTSITVETCIRTDLYQNDVKQDKWVVLVHLTKKPSSSLLRFVLEDTSILLTTNFDTLDDSPAKVQRQTLTPSLIKEVIPILLSFDITSSSLSEHCGGSLDIQLQQFWHERSTYV